MSLSVAHGEYRFLVLWLRVCVHKCVFFAVAPEAGLRSVTRSNSKQAPTAHTNTLTFVSSRLLCISGHAVSTYVRRHVCMQCMYVCMYVMIGMLPVFGEQLHVRHVRYQLSSVPVHWGSHSDAGHYAALLYNLDDGSMYHADDNDPGNRSQQKEAEQMARDSYLFYYVRCQ